APIRRDPEQYSMSVRLRFNLILVGTFLLGLMGSAAYYEREIGRSAREAVESEARLQMKMAMAVRQYIVERVDPHALAASSNDAFAIGAVPAFAARETLALLHRDYPGYHFREAALNPTNPLNRAVDWERALIEHYRDGSVRGAHVSVTEGPSGRTLHVARPMTVADAAFLRCHGDPAHAPAAMRALYPCHGGFNWRVGETVRAR